MAPGFPLIDGQQFHAPDMGGSPRGPGDIPPPPQWLLEDIEDASPSEYQEYGGLPQEDWEEPAEAPAEEDSYSPPPSPYSEPEPDELPTDQNPGIEPDNDFQVGAWDQPMPQSHAPDPPTRTEIPVQDQSWEQKAPEADYEQLFGNTPPPPPQPHRESTPRVHIKPSTNEGYDPSLESSDQFSLPTRIDNPIPTDLTPPAQPSEEDLYSAKTPLSLSANRNPGILDDEQHSAPGYNQPSTRELTGGTIPDPTTGDKPSPSEDQYSGFGSELSRADINIGVPLGKAESLGLDPDTGRDPKTGEGSNSYWDDSREKRSDEPDPGVLGWRIAGGTWLLFTILMAVPFLDSGVGIPTTASILGPLGAMGLILLSGWRWTGLVALGAATIYSMFFGFLGYLLIFDIHTLTVFGDIGQLPPEFGIGMMVIGATFLFSNALLLVAAPETTRAVLGSLITLIPATAAVGFFMFGETRPRLHTPLIGYSPSEFESSDPRFRFIKPAGWTVFHWEDIRDHSRLGRGLTTEPNFYFVDQDQALLFKIYIKPAPRRSLADLLGGHTLTPLEIEATRGFPANESQPETFPFKGTDITISETTHDGVLEDGTSLSVTLDRMEVAGKMLLVVMTRDVHSGVSHSVAEHELNMFFKDLEFVP